MVTAPSELPWYLENSVSKAFSSMLFKAAASWAETGVEKSLFSFIIYDVYPSLQGSSSI